ncbi:MAG TPA: response regulator [Mycobacterium sp.]|nr:response regulator [Mycobacterium sp.]
MSAHADLAHPLADGSLCPARSPIRVAFADDYRVMRRGLRSSLDSERDSAAVAEAGDRLAVGDLVQAYVPDVLVVDLRLPDGSGSN